MVISPATMARPVVTIVSQATRAVRVLGEDGVEDGVGDLVGHLVGMALGDRLRGEGPAGHSGLLSMRGAVRAGRQTLAVGDDGVEHRRGDGPLVGRARPRASTPAADTIVTCVGVVLEADAGALTSLATMRSRPLRASFSLGVGRGGRSVSAAKPTSVWPGALARAEAGEDVGRRLEDDRRARRRPS